MGDPKAMTINTVCIGQDRPTFDEFYEEQVKRVTLFVVVVWEDQTQTQPAWADTRVICMRPGTIEAGSRNPTSTAVKNAISAVRVGSVSLGLGVVMWMML